MQMSPLVGLIEANYCSLVACIPVTLPRIFLKQKMDALEDALSHILGLGAKTLTTHITCKSIFRRKIENKIIMNSEIQ